MQRARYQPVVDDDLRHIGFAFRGRAANRREMHRYTVRDIDRVWGDNGDNLTAAVQRIVQQNPGMFVQISAEFGHGRWASTSVVTGDEERIAMKRPGADSHYETDDNDEFPVPTRKIGRAHV